MVSEEVGGQGWCGARIVWDLLEEDLGGYEDERVAQVRRRVERFDDLLLLLLLPEPERSPARERRMGHGR
jgi:hypothetical protein